MASGWYRIKIEGFPKDPQKWEQLLREDVASFLLRMENSGAIIRFFFLNEPGQPYHTMLVFFGDIDGVMGELRSCGLHGRLVETGPPEHPLYQNYDPKSEQRFHPHYLLGIALFELGSRFAMVSRSHEMPRDAAEGREILVAFRHAFCNGLLMRPDPDPLAHELDPHLDEIYKILTREYPEAWLMRAPRPN